MEFGRAFTFITEDPDWLKKLGVAGLVMFIPLIGSIIVMGWMLEITRRVIADESQALPGWENVGALLTNGLKAFVVSFAYSLPIIFLSFCSQLLIPFMDQNGNQEFLTAALGIFTFCLSCFIIIFSLILALIIPAAFGTLAVNGEIKDAFNFNQVFGLIRSAAGPYLLTIVGSMVGSFIASMGLILCFVGIIVTAPFAMAVQGHLYGQAYKAATAAQSLATEL